MNSVSKRFLEWDSEFFGLRIAKVEVKESEQSDYIDELRNTVRTLRAENCDLAYIEIPFQETLPRFGSEYGSLVDVKLTYTTEFENKAQEITDENIEEISEPSDKLYDLALLSGHRSRYKTDTHFAKGEFVRFYKTWIDNSLNGTIADKTIGYVQEGQLLGFITLKIKDGSGEIGLFAVDSRSQGKGIGQKLMDAAVEATHEAGKSVLHVSTQKDNSGACRFYEKYGFRLTSATAIYHKWFKK